MLFGGFVLALCSSALIAGCAAPAEPDESVGNVEGELDGRKVDKGGADGSPSAAKSVIGTVPPPPVDVRETRPLAWTGRLSAGTSDAPNEERATDQTSSGDAQEPDPVPWHPSLGDKNDTSAHSDTDDAN